MRPHFSRGSGADHIRHAANSGEDASDGKSSTNRFSRHSGAGGVLSDLVALVRPSVVTYERRLNNVPGQANGQKKLTRFADRLDALPRSWRWDSFNKVLNQIVGDTGHSNYGSVSFPVPLGGLPMPLRTTPLTALASRIGSLPEPARQVSAFDEVLTAYSDLNTFATNSTGLTRSQMQEELPELRKALESAISHLPEDARLQKRESLDAIS